MWLLRHEGFADATGNIFAFYRAASEKVNRDEILLMSRNKGKDFDIVYRHPWNISTCPMSSASFGVTADRVIAAAETHGKVFFVGVDPKTGKVSEAESTDTKAKHPALASNAKGEILLAWTEGTGWAKGGSVAWQLYDATGNPTGQRGKVEGLPAWSLPTVFASRDAFTIVY